MAAAAASLAVMGIGLELGMGQINATQNLAGPVGNATTLTTSGAAPAATATPTPTSSADAGGTAVSDAAASGTFAGSSVQTRFGNMQVSVTIDAGAITEVTALQLTNHDGRSVQISNYAAPILRSEVLSAQSANVKGVSGATYTSSGYLQSLQSALDSAGF
ncbi:FMN-binding protein [Cryobacterium psychrophilum]|uniref:FMN-binding protein n=2 Tax=Cryobacterium psychrophilum TaxID=41988 RepID=A0A4Y8KW92_9MICO|nr:FMN-binding protein [Cryobacterium psychrophilum]TFD81900.1 FMN-binding protein [Cryobacterium psychrophilum]